MLRSQGGNTQLDVFFWKKKGQGQELRVLGGSESKISRSSLKEDLYDMGSNPMRKILSS